MCDKYDLYSLPRAHSSETHTHKHCKGTDVKPDSQGKQLRHVTEAVVGQRADLVVTQIAAKGNKTRYIKHTAHAWNRCTHIPVICSIKLFFALLCLGCRANMRAKLGYINIQHRAPTEDHSVSFGLSKQIAENRAKSWPVCIWVCKRLFLTFMNPCLTCWGHRGETYMSVKCL